MTAYFAIHVKHSPAIIYRDSCLAVEPSAQPTNPRIDRWNESPSEEQELNKMEADSGMPEKSSDWAFRL